LYEQTLSTSQTQAKLNAMKKLGVPYTDAEIANAVADLNTQSKAIQARLAEEKIKVSADKEIIAMIAYLQRLGTDISKK
jgi:cytochrome c oxidase cbb3-type subunit I/II